MEDEESSYKNQFQPISFEPMNAAPPYTSNVTNLGNNISEPVSVKVNKRDDG